MKELRHAADFLGKGLAALSVSKAAFIGELRRVFILVGVLGLVTLGMRDSDLKDVRQVEAFLGEVQADFYGTREDTLIGNGQAFLYCDPFSSSSSSGRGNDVAISATV